MVDKELKVSEKSRLITLILCLLFGWAGVHRFYLNKIGTGLMMMFTVGGGGMWYIIDLFMVAIGALKDKDNLPISKW